jgi:hypothetical protein
MSRRGDSIRRWLPVVVPIVLIGGYLTYRAVLNATRHQWKLAVVDLLGILIVVTIVFVLDLINRWALRRDQR